jgi:uncharacterized protein (TIGR02145 family)
VSGSITVNANTYTVRSIGGIWWMTQNFEGAQGSGFTTGSDATYYSKAAALRNAPAGWRLPTSAEVNYVLKLWLNAHTDKYSEWDEGTGVLAGYISENELSNLNPSVNGALNEDGYGYGYWWQVSGYFEAYSTASAQASWNVPHFITSTTSDSRDGYHLTVRYVRVN